MDHSAPVSHGLIRLSELVGAGPVERHLEPGPPVSAAYRATVAGEALSPALDALTDWAARRLPRSPT